MGGGKNKSTTTVQMTPEQQRALSAQTDALTSTFLPAYQNTIGMANNVYGQVNPAATTAAQTAMNVAQQAGGLQQQGGTGAYQQGLGGSAQLAGYQTGLGQGLTSTGAGQLSQLFSPQFKQEQIQASMQPAREEIRNQLAGQNAMYGGAGGLGSSRQALADRNLSQLGEQRLGTVAAQTSAGVEAQRQAAANALLGAGQTALGAGQQGYGNLANLGQQGLTAAQQSAATRIGYAQTPQDTLAKYAQVIYGTPQASTAPNFAGTQGQSGSSKGFGIQAPKWGG